MFDVNPNPETSARRVTSVFGETENGAALHALRGGAEEFGLSGDSAELIIREVKSGISSWKKYAKIAKIPKSEQSRFRWVFEVDY
jgi:serine/threonine-protein kinase HipA